MARHNMYRKKMAKFEHVVFDTCGQTDIQIIHIYMYIHTLITDYVPLPVAM